MSWYHKTLKDMKRAAEREDWNEVVRILKQHNEKFDDEGFEHGISEARIRMGDYDTALNQINNLLP